MTIRSWVTLFWTTLFIGSFGGMLAGVYLQMTDQEVIFFGGAAAGYNLLVMGLAGGTISILSQMGFFAYLSLRFIAVSIFRQKYMWNILQIAIIIVAIFDSFYLRYDGEHLGAYLIFPITVLIIGLVVSFIKVKQSNKSAFIPSLFFTVGATIIEAVPALKLGNSASTFFMMVPLMACNVWQLLLLPRLLKGKKELA
ncbi:KinB-signaling pathway activation protein [Paenibacillus sp. y28]|uniref:KinB-signaling pathway activation protein n=1 Tax=Paenibacillus sp. y28 TaxID=3129110 RepID=UPI0030177205